MTCNPRALVSAVAVMLAMSAVLASTASAETWFHSNAASTNISAEQTGPTPHILDTTAGDVTCEKATFTGSQAAATAKTLKLKPTYSGCHIIVFGSTISATVNMNGCEYSLSSTGAADLICPEGKSAVVTAAGCTVTVGAQELGKAEYSNSGGHIDITASFSGIDYTHSGFTCGFGSGSDGTYTGETTVSGANTSGRSITIWRGNPPEIHSDAQSTKISAEQAGPTPHVLDTTAGEVTCEKATFTGTQTGKVATDIKFKPVYSGCHIIILGNTLSSTISMNGCEYSLSVTGTFDLICPAGQAITVSSSGCTIAIGSQAGIEESTYSNTPRKGNINEHLSITTHLEDINYSHSGFTCGFGIGDNGTYDGITTAKGTDTSDNPVNIWVD